MDCASKTRSTTPLTSVAQSTCKRRLGNVVLGGGIATANDTIVLRLSTGTHFIALEED